MVSKKKMEKVARNIVRTSFAIKPKDVVSIVAGPNSLKFAEALAYESAIVGAQPQITYSSDDVNLKIYKRVDPKFLKYKPKLAYAQLKIVNSTMVIDDENPFIAMLMPQKKLEIKRKATKHYKRLRDRLLAKKKIKLALIGFPNKELARAIKIQFNRLDRIFWDTLDTDYNNIDKFNKRLIAKLKGGRIRIVGDRTDLRFSIKGRTLFSACGIVAKEKMGYLNLPDGEVFCAPVENSANGEIYFDLQCMYHYGKLVKGVWFKFKNGKVVKYKIDVGQKNFEDVIKNASGRKMFIAELGIGTNPKAKITGGMIIVDEKVKGTIHIAIGDNKLFGGRNEATMHWDFFKTMGKGSRLYSDKKLIMKDGKFIL